MEGQRSTVERFSEAFEFDHASSSNAWTNVSSPGDAQNLSDYLLSPSEANMPYRDVVDHETESLNWNLAGSSSSEPMTGRDSHVETKMDNGWMSSLTANASAGPSLEVRRMEASNMLSLDNASINLNMNQIEQDQLLQNSSSNDAAPSLDCNTGLTRNGGRVTQAGICPIYNPFVSEAEQIPSARCFTNACGSSSGGSGNVSEDNDSRLGHSLDSRRLSGKRKNSEGFSGQSSRSGSHSCFHQTESSLLHAVSARHISSSSTNISASLGNPSSANLPEEHSNLRYNAGTRERASEFLLNVECAENSQRNFRMRMNPGSQADSSIPNLWPVGDSSRHLSVGSPHQPSALLVPCDQSLEARLAMSSASSQNQSLQSVPGLPQLVHPLTRNGTSSSQMGSSSNSPPSSSSTERSATARQERHLWGTQRNTVFEQSMVVPATYARHVAQDPTDWSLANGNVSIPGVVASSSQVSSGSGAHSSITPPRVPHQNRPTQYPETPSELVRQTFPTASSDPGGHLNDFLPQHLRHSSSPHEITHQPGVSLRIHQQQYLRSALLMDRRHDVVGAPMTLRMLAAAREGRSRMISEHIRNALDLMRRGENIRFEDVLILDQSAFYGLADLHDRHRDMRLDVDSMSYEELLALEERIGNVSTGLSEETILKHLKKRKYLSITIASPNEVEPCCICQEDYLDNEDIGTLDCGHDFHSACIKQWLTYKNLCPICKMTALVTGN